MRGAIIKKCVEKLSEVVTLKYPALCWYFSDEDIDGSFIFKNKRWVCMYMYWKKMMIKGDRFRYSDDNGNACCGSKEFFGFTELSGGDGVFIAETERFKKSIKLAQDYYRESLEYIRKPEKKYLYSEQVHTVADDMDIRVINLFPDILGLTNLVALSGYDREGGDDNIIVPFAAACEAAFTIPYNEWFKEKPRSVIGSMDVLVRNYIPDDMIMFSLPANRFVEMVDNIDGSFLDKNFKSPLSF
jgi:hypothetical protein